MIGQNDELEHADESDQKYAVERSEKLKQSTRVPPRVLKRGPQLSTKGLRFSKFSKSDSKRRKRSEDDFESENGVNETKELFTDEEQSDGEAVGGGSDSDVDVDVGGGERDSLTPAPTPVGLSSSEKRHNPFKVLS